jgi:organic hydroperoxide reductase OsmC/OhrA
MSGPVHAATIAWRRDDFAPADFAKGRFSRLHRWHFDGGIDVPASASPSIVPAPMGVAEAVDPEEAFVAALAACHMLTFLDLARRGGFVVESYDDDAVGTLGRTDAGRRFIAEVVLHPRIVFSAARQPTAAELDGLHHAAHEHCIIANSALTRVSVAPPAA